MLTLLKYFKKWVLGLFFKVQRPLPETPSGEIKVTGTDSLNELARKFEDNKPAVQREIWFATANNLMDADFDVKDTWRNHHYIPDADQIDETPMTEVLVTKIGRFADEVGETKYIPHRDSKPKTVKYGIYDYPHTPSESHNKSDASDSTNNISINMGANGALGDD